MRHLSASNVMAALALFFALASGSYAALKIPSNSVGSAQIRTNAVRGIDVNERSLGRVPSATTAQSATRADTATRATSADTATNATNAANADRVNGMDANQLRLRCPAGSEYAFGICYDPASSTAKATYQDARNACSDRGGRVPTWYELDGIRQRPGITWANGDPNQYEWTSTLREASTRDLEAMGIGGSQYGPGANDSALLFYRCVYGRING